MNSRRHILVVEDSSTQAQALAALLEEHEYVVAVTTDGEGAIRLLDTNHYDLILTDIVMPRVGGYDLCRYVKQNPRLREIPVVLLTSLTNPHDIVRGLECGADNYITKPYEPRHLLARIRNVLDKRTLRKSTRATMGVEITFMGTTFAVNSETEQILDLFLSSVEDVVHSKQALEEKQRELSSAHAQLATYAREVERRERVSAEKYRNLMQNAFDGIFVLDKHGSIVEANRRGREMARFLAADPVGLKLEQLIAPAQVDAFRVGLARMAELNFLEMKEVGMQTGGAPQIFCDLHASCARDNADYLVLVILQDVTERMRSGAALRDTNEMLQTLIEASPLCIVALDPQGHVTLWNEAAQRTMGWSQAEVLGQPLPGVPADRRAELDRLLDLVLRGERLNGLEVDHYTATGARIELSLWAAPLRDSTGFVRGSVAMLADMSEQKTLQEQLRQAQKMEAVGTLAGGIAHDFNNMLTAISGYADMVLGDISEPRVKSDVEEIKKASARAAALTRQLLAFSRKQVLQPRLVNLNEIISNIHPMLRRLVREDIPIDLDLEPALAPVHVDPTQMEQVLMNLIVNARDALHAGGSIEIRTRNAPPGPDAAARRNSVLLQVSDNGMGMDPETQQHVFEPFFTTKGKDQGTGLGLSTVYGIVKQSGGQIEIASAPEQGSTISIFLPAHDGEPEKLREAQPAPRLEGKGTTILLVEDETAVRQLLSRLLKRRGFHVLEAANGAEALELADKYEGEIALVLTDIVMPEIGGALLGRLLQQKRPSVKLLYMSGYAAEALQQDLSIEAEAVLIEKPFTHDALFQKIHEVLNGLRR